MSDLSTAAQKGEIDVIFLLLNEVLATFTPLQAAQACVNIATEREVMRNEREPDTPQEQIAAQEGLLEAYLGLLSSLARNG